MTESSPTRHGSGARLDANGAGGGSPEYHASTSTAGAGYDELVERSPQGSVFASSWWLDAVASGAWRANVLEAGGEVVAAWPTVVRASRFGDLHAGAPLTPYLGPLLTPGDGVHARSRELEQLEGLVASLGRFAHLEATCNPAFDYWAPLHWQGFRQTSYFTWRLADVRDSERVFASVRENVRREVRKARKRGLVVEEGALNEYLAVHGDTAARQGREAAARSNAAVLARIDTAAGPRGARTILLARDGDGRVHAGGYFVHDARWTYYLAGGSDAELRTSGAPSLVLWSAIEQAGRRGTGFDFEGSMLRPVERFFRAFGGAPTPYSIVRSTRSRTYSSVFALKRAAFAVGVRR